MKNLIKKGLTLCCVFITIALFGTQSWATSLSFVPSSSSINIGDYLYVDVVISDLGGSYVGAFDFNVNYDDTVLALDSFSLTENLGEIPDDAFDWSWGNLGFGTVNLSELSLLWDFTALQDGSSVTLATLLFTGSSIGESELSFSNVTISDDWWSSLDVSLSDASINVTDPVPEPATLLLMAIGLAGLYGAGMRRKKRCNVQ